MRSWLLRLGVFSVCASPFFACGSDDNHGKRAENGGEPSAGAGGEPTASGAGGAPSDGGADPETSGGAAGAGTSAVQDDLGVLNEFCDRFAQTECDARSACYGIDEGCLSQTLHYCHEYGRAEVLPALAAGVLEYDADKAEACFSASLEGFCNTNNLWYVRECREVFKGTTSGDDPCYRLYFLSQTLDTCADGTKCDAAIGAECGSGRCQPYFTGNEPCRDANNVLIEPGCAPGFLCDETSKRCVAEKARHDPCTSIGQQCNISLPLLMCVPRADGAEALECDVRRPAGEVCGLPSGPQTSIACASLVCTQGKCSDHNASGETYCFQGDTVCAAGEVCLYQADSEPVCGPPIAEGDPCTTAGNVCAKGLVCVADDPETPTAGTCQPLTAEGENCQDLGCVEGLTCVGLDEAATCLPTVGKGEPCSEPGSNECAPGLHCLATTSTCGATLPIGGACVADSDCDGGLYCDDSTETCLPWKRNGEACGRQGECVYFNGCSADGICESVCTP